MRPVQGVIVDEHEDDSMDSVTGVAGLRASVEDDPTREETVETREEGELLPTGDFLPSVNPRVRNMPNLPDGINQYPRGTCNLFRR